MDKLEKYVINHSSCGMPRCEYVENGTDIDCDDCQKIMLAEHDAKVRADAIEELKPFFDECEELVFDWICDDLCGEFINPDTDESWCAEHCHNGTGYECIKKWCELKQMKEQKE